MLEEFETTIRGHHAFIIPGDPNHSVSLVRTMYQDTGIPVQNFKGDSETGKFTIDVAREVAHRAIESGVSILAISAHTILPEAQNTLLKILEEPHPDKKIFICVSALHEILDTIISRCVVLDINDPESDCSYDSDIFYDIVSEIVYAKNFDSRITAVGKIKKEELGSPLVQAILDEVRRAIEGQLNIGSTQRIDALSLLSTAYQHNTRAHVPRQMILEHLFTYLPIFNLRDN